MRIFTLVALIHIAVAKQERYDEKSSYGDKGIRFVIDVPWNINKH